MHFRKKLGRASPDLLAQRHGQRVRAREVEVREASKIQRMSGRGRGAGSAESSRSRIDEWFPTKVSLGVIITNKLLAFLHLLSAGKKPLFLSSPNHAHTTF